MSERSKLLWAVCIQKPEDYEPYGQEADRQADCSCGCKWYYAHDADWGTCFNPASHRAGLLTWEHQGCHHFEPDGSWEEEERMANDYLSARDVGDETPEAPLPPPTRPDMEAIRAREQAATKPPWHNLRDDWELLMLHSEDTEVTLRSDGVLARWYPAFMSEQYPEQQAMRDAEFMTHVREDIPDLLAWVDYLEKLLKDKGNVV